MKAARQLDVAAACIELEIDIAAPPDRVWSALTTETNLWWLPDFHMLGEASTVSFDLTAGGGLVEHMQSGESLLWYTVQWSRPQLFTVYLVGQLAPDFGGPATSHMKICVVAGDQGGSVLQVTDAYHGHIEESTLASLDQGWNSLFRDGLKHFVEKGA